MKSSMAAGALDFTMRRIQVPSVEMKQMLGGASLGAILIVHVWNMEIIMLTR